MVHAEQEQGIGNMSRKNMNRDQKCVANIRRLENEFKELLERLYVESGDRDVRPDLSDIRRNLRKTVKGLDAPPDAKAGDAFILERID